MELEDSLEKFIPSTVKYDLKNFKENNKNVVFGQSFTGVVTSRPLNQKSSLSLSKVLLTPKNLITPLTPKKEKKISSGLTMQEFLDYNSLVKPEWEKFKVIHRKMKEERDEKYMLSDSNIFSSVPDVFFTPSKEFYLNDKSIFEKIMKFEEEDEDKLTGFLDVIEEQLSHEILLKSPKYFSIFSHVNNLNKEIDELLQELNGFKNKIQNFKHNEVNIPLKIVSAKSRINFFNQLLEKLKIIKLVEKNDELIKNYKIDKSIVTILILIDETINVIKINDIDKCELFKTKIKSYGKLKNEIKKLILKKFLEIIILDSNNKEDSQRKNEEGENIISGLNLSVEKKITLEVFLSCLVSMDYFLVCLQEFKKNFITYLKWKSREISKLVLKEIARFLKENNELNFFVFNKYLRKVLDLNLRLIILKLDEIKKLFLKFNRKSNSYNDVEKSKNEIIIEKSFNELIELEILHLISMIEIKNVKKISISTIKEVNSLSRLIKEFILEIEKLFPDLNNKNKINNRFNVNEKFESVFVFLNRIFLNCFFDRMKIQMKTTIENDNWKIAKNEGLLEEINTTIFKTLNSNSKKKQKKRKQETKKYLNVNGELFTITSNFVQVLNLLVSFLELYHNKYIEKTNLTIYIQQLISLYNGECRDYILGAKAVKLKTVKTINARHLIIATECLYALCHFIPLLFNYIPSFLGKKNQNIISTFNNTLKELREHREEIFNKLFEIIRSSLKAKVKNWGKCFLKGSNKNSRKQIEGILGTINFVYDDVFSLFLTTHPTEFKRNFERIATFANQLVMREESKIKEELTKQKKKTESNEGSSSSSSTAKEAKESVDSEESVNDVVDILKTCTEDIHHFTTTLTNYEKDFEKKFKVKLNLR